MRDDILFAVLFSPKKSVTKRDVLDVSKNRGTPKWMVKIMENPIRMDGLGVPLSIIQLAPGGPLW